MPQRPRESPSDPPVPQPGAARVRWRAAGWALLLAAPLLLGLLAEADAERAAVLGLEGPRCVVGEHLGPGWCPGCGLSRGVALLVQGEPGPALALAPAAPAVVLACALGLAAQLVVLLRGRAGPNHRRLTRYGGRALAVALLAGWLLRAL